MVEQTIQILKQRKNNIRCSELQNFLDQLGFIVRHGKKGGHKVFIHPQLSNFESGSFNCDHGKNPQIKSIYVRKIIDILEQHKDELAVLVGVKK